MPVALRLLAQVSGWTLLVPALLMAALLVSSSACAQQKPAPEPMLPVPPAPSAITHRAPTDVLGDYVVGPQDLLTISILESPELSREVRVAADGTIGLPLLAERVRVRGLTLSQAEDLLKQKYEEAGIINHPNVTVAVKELLSRPVTITGAVKNPGVFQVNGNVRLLRLLSMAGGFTEDVGTQVNVLREDTGGEMQLITVVVQELREGKSDANLEIHAGDTINVQPAGAVYVLGAVNHPGRYLLRSDTQQTTILNVLALAEDLKRTAKPGNAVLIRKQIAGSGVDQIPVNIKMILEHKQDDVVVQANDVLYVPDSTAKRAFSRGLEAALQVATGMVLLRRP